MSAEHWDNRYRTTRAHSWDQVTPEPSLELVRLVARNTGDTIIDVGGGASSLVDHLIAAGYTDIAVLDVSAAALATARARAGDTVTWIEADLLVWDPPHRWDVWHDRALLHFLVSDEARARYVEVMRRALEPTGAFVIGTFAEDGPTECSALPVRRYSPAALAELLGGIEVVAQRRALHRTPAGVDQPFNWIAGRLGPGAHAAPR